MGDPVAQSDSLIGESEAPKANMSHSHMVGGLYPPMSQKKGPSILFSLFSFILRINRDHLAQRVGALML